MMPGRARSLSVIASPQVGQATQAIDQRRTAEISSSSFTPCSRKMASSWPLAAGSMSVNNMLWCGVRRMPGASVPQTTRRAVFSRSESSSWMRPFSTFRP